jgi:hypothetical protein
MAGQVSDHEMLIHYTLHSTATTTREMTTRIPPPRGIEVFEIISLPLKVYEIISLYLKVYEIFSIRRH